MTVRISAAGIAVADVGGEEFDEAKLRAIVAGKGNELVHDLPLGCPSDAAQRSKHLMA